MSANANQTTLIVLRETNEQSPLRVGLVAHRCLTGSEVGRNDWVDQLTDTVRSDAFPYACDAATQVLLDSIIGTPAEPGLYLYQEMLERSAHALRLAFDFGSIEERDRWVTVFQAALLDASFNFRGNRSAFNPRFRPVIGLLEARKRLPLPKCSLVPKRAASSTSA